MLNNPSGPIAAISTIPPNFSDKSTIRAPIYERLGGGGVWVVCVTSNQQLKKLLFREFDSDFHQLMFYLYHNMITKWYF